MIKKYTCFLNDSNINNYKFFDYKKNIDFNLKSIFMNCDFLIGI